MAALDIFKRILVVGIIIGLCLLAFFIASETENIIATSDKSILFVMPGVPLVVGLGALIVLDWQRYFVLSTLLLTLFVVCILALIIFETGSSPRDLQSMGQRATIQGGLYIATIVAMVLFVGYGALAGLRGAPETPNAIKVDTEPTAPGFPWIWLIGGALIGCLILVILAYYSAPPEIIDGRRP